MIDWTKVRNFKRSEFHDPIDDHLYDHVIYFLDDYRDALGERVHPSPVSGAIVRFDGSKTSRHYAVGRLSDAIDIFPEGNPIKAWLTAMSMPEWGGIGIYFDTHNDGRPWVMLHLDLRPYVGHMRTVWYRLNGKDYYYPLRNADHASTLAMLLEKYA